MSTKGKDDENLVCGSAEEAARLALTLLESTEPPDSTPDHQESSSESEVVALPKRTKRTKKKKSKAHQWCWPEEKNLWFRKILVRLEIKKEWLIRKGRTAENTTLCFDVMLCVYNLCLICPICDSPSRKPHPVVGLGMIYIMGSCPRLPPNYFFIIFIIFYVFIYNWSISRKTRNRLQHTINDNHKVNKWILKQLSKSNWKRKQNGTNTLNISSRNMCSMKNIVCFRGETPLTKFHLKNHTDVF